MGQIRSLSGWQASSFLPQILLYTKTFFRVAWFQLHELGIANPVPIGNEHTRSGFATAIPGNFFQKGERFGTIFPGTHQQNR
ncbi:MAG: hypothetical protein D6820_07735 [Lentisphaerae bacterium]|nr:MAG: hypothetical protein D6820_07735 [Lentisphaerota bacterium]